MLHYIRPDLYMHKWGLPALAICFITLTLAPSALYAQRERLSGIPQIDRRTTATLRGHVHPAATAANDRGLVDAAMPLPNLTLMMQPSADQQKALEDLLARQQDPASPDYHNWLTPEQYADRFGVSQLW